MLVALFKMAFFYLATATKPSGVTASVTGNFLDPVARCLIVSKHTHFEIYSICPEGLKSVLDVPVFARIAALELLRPKVSSHDFL